MPCPDDCQTQIDALRNDLQQVVDWRNEVQDRLQFAVQRVHELEHAVARFRIVEHTLDLGRGGTSPWGNLPTYLSGNAYAAEVTLPGVDAATDEIAKVWWVFTEPTYQITQFRIIDAEPVAGTANVRLSLLLQNAPPGHAAGQNFGMRLRLCAFVRPRS